MDEEYYRYPLHSPYSISFIETDTAWTAVVDDDFFDTSASSGASFRNTRIGVGVGFF